MSEPKVVIHDYSELDIDDLKDVKDWHSRIYTAFPPPTAVPVSLEALKALKDKFPTPLEKVEIVTVEELTKLRAASKELLAIKKAWGMSPEVEFESNTESPGYREAREAQFKRLEEENAELRELLCQAYGGIAEMKAEIQRLRK